MTETLYSIVCDCYFCREKWFKIENPKGCHIRRCRNLKTFCKDCGRMVCTKTRENMEAKQIRLCIECGKQHDTGVENKLTGEFNRIDKCIDCLMSKCSFKFESRQITLDDIKPMTYDDMQFELGKTVCNVLQAEYGSSSPIGFANATMCDEDGNDMEIKCKCGNEASSVIIGKESYMGLCNKCQYGE